MKTGQRRGAPRAFIIGLAAVLSICTSPVLGQAVIENPSAPASRTAGRTISFKEILKITDESGEFFFKYPRIMAEGPDGSFYVQDNEQILRFDPNGKFVRNYFKKGQGPGEMTYAMGLFATSAGLCVQASGPQKLIWFDDTGKLLKEPSPRPKGRMSMILLGILNGKYIFSGTEFPRISGEPQYVDNPYSLMAWTEASAEPNVLSAFPVNSYIVTSGSGGGGMMSIASFMAVPFGSKSFVVVHTCEYLVKLFDFESNAVVRTFSRKYERVESPPPSAEDKKPVMIINNKQISNPRQKYLNDISKIIARGDKIWVVTSTKDTKKGRLIDVFDAAGKYVDAFFLNIPTGQYAIFGKNLYTAEKLPDETYAIKKYAIEWKD